ESEDIQLDLNGSVIYHCGPIAEKKGGVWRIVSAGPTTSVREEPYEAEVIVRYGVRAVVGKGGMGERTLKALNKEGCVYLSAVGGAGAALAGSVKKVAGVEMLEEFGIPEAIWILEVEGFGPLMVSMDSHTESLYNQVREKSQGNLNTILNDLR
ncbi:MAG: FumA C-terminus/TtdB family hydratase beta subunit, partial [Candidatus Altiarchaeota archaeon]